MTRTQGWARGAAVLALLALASACGQSSSDPGRAQDQISVLPPPTSAAPPSASGSDGAPSAAGSPTGRGAKPLGEAAFHRAMATYCTDFYTGQRDAEEKHPGTTQEAQVAYAQAAANSARRSEGRLDRISPPTELATAFDQFTANAHRISEDRVSILESTRTMGQAGPAGDDFNRAFAERWALAGQLQASGCDGQLPPTQAAAAVAVARDWVRTTDPLVACRDLVTPWFLHTRWNDNPEAEAACVHERTYENTPPYALPSDIRVVTVTGVEDLTATVDYLDVGGCGCSAGGEVRLFYLHGRWLVNAASQ